jgi:hypothetical protein
MCSWFCELNHILITASVRTQQDTAFSLGSSWDAMSLSGLLVLLVPGVLFPSSLLPSLFLSLTSLPVCPS